MNHFSTARLTRITKAAARKLWGKSDISLCPCKLRPDGMWKPNIDVTVKEIKENKEIWGDARKYGWDFDATVQNFEWFNCQLNETGYYTAFYLIKK